MTLKWLYLFQQCILILKLNKWRSSLAMLGIIIGIFGIIVIGVFGENGKAMILSEIQTFGFNTVWVYPKIDETQFDRDVITNTNLTMNDFQAIKSKFSTIQWSTPVVKDFVIAKSNNIIPSKEIRVEMSYVMPSLMLIEKLELIDGRFLNDHDNKTARRVCVIGKNIESRLFLLGSAVGQKILVWDTIFTVVGVLKEHNHQFLDRIGLSSNKIADQIYVPISIAEQRGIRQIDYLQFSVHQMVDVMSTASSIIGYLNQRHNYHFDYQFIAMKQYLDSANQIFNVLSWMLIGSISITIIVGGIGIANIMTISVMERIKEIGIRKSIGASTNEIFGQFLLESIMLTSCAGFIGFLVALIVIGSVGFIIDGFHYISMRYFWIAVGVSIGIGVLSGCYPASWAARLTPSEALRYNQ